MAAYAALVSLQNLMETITNHPHPPITFDKKQSQALRELVSFLQQFLENHPHRGRDAVQEDLEKRIAEAACAAEDAVESYIADIILARTRRHGDDGIPHCKELGNFIKDMDLIKQHVIKIQEKIGIQDPKSKNAISSTSLSKPASTRSLAMVGFDDALIEIMDRLTTQQPTLQILQIVGMGGIGKTTLAKHVYDNLYIVQHFHICIWVTISQDYRVRDILLEALKCVGKTDVDKKLLISSDKMSEASEEELGSLLYKSLWGRRYLVMMDDMWSTEPWDDVKRFFPDNSNRSRIVITTRLSDMAIHLGSSAFQMNFLDKEKSWDLLCRNVFTQTSCPTELEEIGKKIAINCRGLPLSIVLVGGILANSKETREQWEYVAENLHSILHLEDHEHCLNILSLSYNYLPVHLKPCFLYMGVFPEDENICVSMLIKLWVAEGFLKPVEGKSLELVARSYLTDLIGRNLILVNERGCSGKVKFCHIHDLLRGLCLRECHKEKFIGVKGMLNFDNCIHGRSRVSVHKSTREERGSLNEFLEDSESTSSIRSLLCDFKVALPFFKLRLLRVFDSTDKGYFNEGYSPYSMPHLVNSRYLSFRVDWKNFVYLSSNLPPSICQLWNLQTVIVKGTWIEPFILPLEIWEMSQLRNLHVDRHFLPSPSNPPMHKVDPFVLKNLQRLSVTVNFKFTKDAITRIPNINKMHIVYDNLHEGLSSNCCLNNLRCLNKLESLVCVFPSANCQLVLQQQDLTFPFSLKKLTLSFARLNWEDMTKIGSLPHLEVLKLEWESFCGPQWIPVEGEFLSLKFLLIQYCKDLVYWTADKTHFPRLEHLVLEGLYNLNDIPLDIGEIPTLRLMELIYCSNSAVISAKNILDEQENLGNESLRVRVRLSAQNELDLAEVESLASDNFEVQDRFGGRWVG
ncbi:putative late blight resistance protein homolog R1A-10 [Primulina eburnea]|uniref:putative late blight resistance protein homolog R1A-10 n=1 Tax=Primulina eburnea TaxID=1245227 RepID=UPI003C6C803D